MTIPVSIQQRIRILDARGRLVARDRQTAERVQGHRPQVRRDGGLLARAQGPFLRALGDGRVFVSSGFVAGRRPAHAAQAAAYRQACVRPTGRGGGVHRLVFHGAALREALAGGSPAAGRRFHGTRVEAGDHAGRFRPGAGGDRWGGIHGALPGRLVPAFEHAVRRGPARGRTRSAYARGCWRSSSTSAWSRR